MFLLLCLVLLVLCCDLCCCDVTCVDWCCDVVTSVVDVVVLLCM